MKKLQLTALVLCLALFLSFSAVFAQDAETGVATEDVVDTSQEFMDSVDSLFKDGYISSDAGEFYYADDFEDDWAQMYWYQWTYLADMQLQNFVVRAKVSWESASATPQWGDSGCGFIFRETDTKNHLKANIALDGAVYINGYKNDKWLSYGKKQFASHSTKGSAYLTVAADKDKVTVLVDDEVVLKASNVLLTEAGKLAYVVVSGTNKDYGTRCKFEGVEIYVFD